jgi:hypothetical protein
MRLKRRVLLMLGLPILLAPAMAAATPAGFGCLWPLNNLAIKPDQSRFYYDHTEWVFDLRVYLNQPAASPDAISIGEGSPGPHKVGVCKIVLPNLEQLRGRIYWRELDSGNDARNRSDVYRSIDIREAGTGGSFTEWLVFRPMNTSVRGATTIEFRVDSGYSSDAD